MTPTSLTFQLVGGGPDILVRHSVPAIPSVGHHLMLGTKAYVVTDIVWMVPQRPERADGLDVYAIVELVTEASPKKKRRTSQPSSDPVNAGSQRTTEKK